MSKSIHMSTTTTKKRAPNAYNIYCQDEQLRSSIKKENPDWASSEVMKELGKRWQQLSEQTLIENEFSSEREQADCFLDVRFSPSFRHSHHPVQSSLSAVQRLIQDSIPMLG